MTLDPDDETRHRDLDSTDQPSRAESAWDADTLYFLRPPTRGGDLGTLGGFRILRLIARGGMGMVFAAHDPAADREVAIKVIRPEALALPAIRERFTREARALAALDHPNVVPLYQVGEDNRVPFLVMPLLVGEPLDKRLARGPMSVLELLRLAYGVARGLAAAHRRGLIHRDLKPSNLWLDGGGGGEWERVRVFDFGLVTGPAGDAHTLPDQFVGTPAFTSPEQARLEEARPTSDLFSLGSVLYKAATGQNPFPERGMRATLHTVATEEPKPPVALRPDLPPAWSALILRLMAKNPDDRPQSATALLHELDRLAPKTRRVWLIGSFVVVMLLLVIPFMLLLRPTTPPNGTGQERPTDLPPLAAKVNVEVVRQLRTGNRGYISQPAMRPCENGDRLRLVAEANRPAYLYLFVFDEDGKLSFYHPCNPAKGWASRPAKESPQTVVFDPPDDPTLPPDRVNGYKMEGDTSGMVTVILVARLTPLDLPEADIRKWFDGLTPIQKPDDLAAVAWYDNGKLKTDDPTRGPSVNAEVVLQPAMALQNALTRRIQPHADFVAAVQFGKRGTR